jgi:hypothetical protein
MTPEVRLVGELDFDFDSFLVIADKLFGFSPARGTDAARRRLSTSEKLTSCLESIAGAANYQEHSFFNLVLAADGDDFVSIIHRTGMPFVARETQADGIYFALVSGTLGQWRKAIHDGLSDSGNVAICYQKIVSEFERIGLDLGTKRLECK